MRTFSAHVINNQSNVYVIVHIEYEYGIYISDKAVTFEDEYCRPLLTDGKSIKISDSLDMFTKKYKVSNLNIKISDSLKDGKRFGDEVNGGIALLNKIVNVYFVHPDALLFSECLLVGKYIVRDIGNVDGNIILDCEDSSPKDFFKELPQTQANTGVSDFQVPKSEMNRYIPIVYGRVIGSPGVKTYSNVTTSTGESGINNNIQIKFDTEVPSFFAGQIHNNTSTKPLLFYENSLNRFVSVSKEKTADILFDPDAVDEEGEPLEGVALEIEPSIYTVDESQGVINISIITDDVLPNMPGLDYYEVKLRPNLITRGFLNYNLNEVVDADATTWDENTITVHPSIGDGLYGESDVFSVHSSGSVYDEYRAFGTVYDSDLVDSSPFSIIGIRNMYEKVQFDSDVLLSNIVMFVEVKQFEGAEGNSHFSVPGHSHSDQVILNQDQINFFTEYQRTSESTDTYNMTWGIISNSHSSQDLLYDFQVSQSDIAYTFLKKGFSKEPLFASVEGRGGNNPSALSVVTDILETELGYAGDVIITPSGIDDLFDFEFTVEKRINSKKLIEQFLKSTPYLGLYKEGQFNMVGIKNNYSDYNHLIYPADITKLSTKRTDLKKVYTRVKVKYHYNYASGDYDKETEFFTPANIGSIHQTYVDESGATPVEITGYENSYYGIEGEQELIFESDYIRSSNAANELARYLVGQHCNQHNIFTIQTGLKYAVVKIGEIVKFAGLYEERPLFNEDYTLPWLRNGQVVLPYFMVTGAKKDISGVELTLIQLHQFDETLTDGQCGDSGFVEYWGYNNVDINSGGFHIDNRVCQVVYAPLLPEITGNCLIGNETIQNTPTECTALGGEWQYEPFIAGCTELNALNFDPEANYNPNDACLYPMIMGAPVITEPYSFTPEGYTEDDFILFYWLSTDTYFGIIDVIWLEAENINYAGTFGYYFIRITEAFTDESIYQSDNIYSGAEGGMYMHQIDVIQLPVEANVLLKFELFAYNEQYINDIPVIQNEGGFSVTERYFRFQIAAADEVVQSLPFFPSFINYMPDVVLNTPTVGLGQTPYHTITLNNFQVMSIEGDPPHFPLTTQGAPSWYPQFTPHFGIEASVFIGYHNIPTIYTDYEHPNTSLHMRLHGTLIFDNIEMTSLGSGYYNLSATSVGFYPFISNMYNFGNQENSYPGGFTNDPDYVKLTHNIRLDMEGTEDGSGTPWANNNTDGSLTYKPWDWIGYAPNAGFPNIKSKWSDYLLEQSSFPSPDNFGITGGGITELRVSQIRVHWLDHVGNMHTHIFPNIDSGGSPDSWTLIDNPWSWGEE